jgi:hypothetical protein
MALPERSPTLAWAGVSELPQPLGHLEQHLFLLVRRQGIEDIQEFLTVECEVPSVTHDYP